MSRRLKQSNRSIIRNQMRAKRAALSAAEKLRAAHALSKQLELIPEILLDQHIAGYFAVNGEIGLHFWWSRMQLRGQHYYLPRIIEVNQTELQTTSAKSGTIQMAANNLAVLQFAPVNDGDTLPPNRFGIPEPLASNALVDADALDVILLPLTAFDRQGHRLGMGGGYYDRSLHFLAEQKRPAKPLLIGVGYGFQEVESIARQAWDIQLDFIATEQELIQCFKDPDH
jgi:5-formyltetrahydrofolate cyclo-ligase